MRFLQRWDKHNQEWAESNPSGSLEPESPFARRFLHGYVAYKLAVFGLIVVLFIVALVVRAVQ